MPSTPLISVIVLNYNGVAHLHECFASLVRLDYPRDRLELILVDNASTDSSVAVVRESFPDVQIVLLDENLGLRRWKQCRRGGGTRRICRLFEQRHVGAA